LCCYTRNGRPRDALPDRPRDVQTGRAKRFQVIGARGQVARVFVFVYHSSLSYDVVANGRTNRNASSPRAITTDDVSRFPSITSETSRIVSHVTYGNRRIRPVGCSVMSRARPGRAAILVHGVPDIIVSSCDSHGADTFKTNFNIMLSAYARGKSDPKHRDRMRSER